MEGPARFLRAAAEAFRRRRSLEVPLRRRDYYEQPGKLFRVMTPEQQEALFGNTARAMAGVPREIQIRHIYNCSKADPAYGKGVADAPRASP